jgi:hypothetical protein
MNSGQVASIAPREHVRPQVGTGSQGHKFEHQTSRDELSPRRGLCGVQKQLGLFGIAVTPGFVTLEQMKRHQCIEEVTGGPFMEAKPLAQFVLPERPAFKGAKHPEFVSAQERLRGPESRRELHDPIMGNLLCHFPSSSVAITRATNPADGIS